MDTFIACFISFLTSIVNFDLFVYLLAAFALFAVIQLVRRAVYG